MFHFAFGVRLASRNLLCWYGYLLLLLMCQTIGLVLLKGSTLNRGGFVHFLNNDRGAVLFDLGMRSVLLMSS